MMKALLGVALVAAIVGAVLFEPWRLFTDSTVDEPAPTSAVAEDSTGVDPPADGPSSDEPSSDAPSSPTAAPREDQVLAEGEFEDAEHPTDGAVRVLQLADGRRFVRLEGLATSDGPDLHVWLTDQRSGGDWGSYDDGRYLRLGELKANNGNQNYAIPAKADLEGLTSVVIWCDRFNVAFGTAPVTL